MSVKPRRGCGFLLLVLMMLVSILAGGVSLYWAYWANEDISTKETPQHIQNTENENEEWSAANSLGLKKSKNSKVFRTDPEERENRKLHPLEGEGPNSGYLPLTMGEDCVYVHENGQQHIVPCPPEILQKAKETSRKNSAGDTWP